MNDFTTPSPAPWADQVELLLDLAVSDLDAGDDVRPTMIAFCGDVPLFLATLRPFDKGHHSDPIIELGAIAWGLGADRVGLSLAGRAWSLNDPVPPVLPGVGDLRQRVITVHTADAATAYDHDDDGEERSVVSTTVVVPVDVDADTGEVRCGRRISEPDGVGWVPRALSAIAQAGAERGLELSHSATEDRALAHQIRRCERLGHRLAWPSDLAHRG